MKKIISILAMVTILVVSACALTGCGKKKKLQTVTFKDKDTKVSVNLSFEEGANYTLSENKEEFRTSREDAILKGDNFNIAIQMDEFFGSETINDLKENDKERKDYKEVTYNGVQGYSYYYSSYNRYEVVLPATEKVYVTFHIYTQDFGGKEDDAKTTFDSSVVQDILNTVSFSAE